MDWPTFLQSLEQSSVGTAIRESGTLFPWIESTHVLMITAVVGTISIVDLKLLGLGGYRRGAKQLIRDLLPYTWVAFVIAAITGGLLFMSNAQMYWQSIPYRLKLVAIVLAGLNMVVFHLGAYRKIGDWDIESPPSAAKLAGILSLSLWVTVIFLGRWIGFSAPFA